MKGRVLLHQVDNVQNIKEQIFCTKWIICEFRTTAGFSTQLFRAFKNCCLLLFQQLKLFFLSYIKNKNKNKNKCDIIELLLSKIVIAPSGQCYPLAKG